MASQDEDLQAMAEILRTVIIQPEYWISSQGGEPDGFCKLCGRSYWHDPDPGDDPANSHDGDCPSILAVPYVEKYAKRKE